MTVAVLERTDDRDAAVDLPTAARIQLDEAIAAGRLPARPDAEVLGKVADIVADVGLRAG